ncbi:hypothetical protein GTID1_07540 [Geobacillus thermodenitrificans]|nr:hypothetical protein GTID1_07540 [Geobacillus thermodenitrificans]
MRAEVKEICKALHLAYIADRFEEVRFETKEQFLRDVFVNYHFISEQKSHFFAHSFRKPSPLF